MYGSIARRRSFEAIPETCPAQDAKADEVLATFAKFREQETDSRIAFRSKLEEAYEEVEKLETRIEELESEEEGYKDEIAKLESEVKQLERELQKV